MIVRTYARRNRCVSRSFSDSGFNGGTEDGFQDSLSQESSQEVFGIGFSSQDSSPWSFDSDLYGSSSNRDPDSQALLPPRPVQNGKEIRKSTTSRKTARERERGTGEFRNPNFGGSKVGRTISAPSTSTLMEAQEFGEMMEHVDEVNFALDGLKPGQPSRVRRSSLLSLLSICVTGQQRRLLRAQGMARTIVDAILALSFDDSPSTLAAAALFYVFASDGQDDHLLDSPPCIHFLLKLLNPPMADIIEDKVPNVGGKFLSISRDPSILRGVAKRLDCSSTAIVSKVQEVLISCKEIKPWNGEGDGLGRPELNSKWIALLTMEKACLSAVSLEDTSGTVRRVGGNFKEKLRELGGLDSVFDVATSCHTDLEGQLKHLPSSQELKNDSVFQSVVALLKCLQIMVNATFLSTDNQNHLLGMSAKLDSEGSPISFVGFVIRAIKILSGLFLLESALISSYEKSTNLYDEANNQLKDGHKVSGGMDGSASGDSIRKCCITETSSLNGSFIAARKRRRLSMSQPEVPASAPATTSTSASDVYSVTEGANSTFPILSHSSLRRLNEANFYVNGSKMDETHLGAGDTQLVSLVDSEDPFAFDEFDLAPSKWELLSMKKAVSRTQKSRKVRSEPDYGCELRVATTIDESTIDENLSSCETSGSSAIEEENSNLVGDCLLTAIKVLVNLTNDNPLGCQQIASCGGLDAMAALIIAHFPMYSCGLSKDSQISSFKLKNTTDLDHRESKPLCDQELEFLVAILGLLVNLVEKDDRNRSRLAAASVALRRPGGTDGKESHIDVIVLLCSIFLANQGSSEAAEGKLLPWNDEAALLQGEREAEQMIIEAYAALLLAFLSTESLRVRDAISGYLPNHNLQVLVPVLERFVAFHLALNMISPETHATVTKVIESCRGE